MTIKEVSSAHDCKIPTVRRLGACKMSACKGLKMLLRDKKSYIHCMSIFFTLLMLIAISSQTAHAATHPSTKSLTKEAVIALRADNGLYLSRINYGGENGTNPIEAAKKTIDPYSEFTIVQLSNGNFTLQADNGLYLSRIHYGGKNGTNPIEAAKKTIDPSSQFAILVFLANGKIALQADNGLYLSRINYGGTNGTNPIEAAKTSLDPYSQFTVITVTQPS
jgi:hypothetical protein